MGKAAKKIRYYVNLYKTPYQLKHRIKPVRFYEVYRKKVGKGWFIYGLGDIHQHGARGWCFRPIKTGVDRHNKYIVIDFKQMRSWYGTLQVLLHETIHGLFPDASEAKVEEAGYVLARAAVSLPKIRKQHKNW